MLKLVVIGLEAQDEADCATWTQPFLNVEEYYALILNLPSLDQNQLGRTASAKPLWTCWLRSSNGTS
jgi:hypothetical protein